MVMRNLRIVLLALATLALAGLAAAQGEPTLQQIYAAAQSGQVDKARQMTQEVLRNQPKSAKAHFVMAELEASQGNVARARDELAAAESLAPGLPFARPDAVQALRTQVGATAGARPAEARRAPAATMVRGAEPASSFPWAMVLLGAVVVAVGATVLRSRAASRAAARQATPSGRFGAAANGAGWGAQQPGYGPQPGCGPVPGTGLQPGYGQQPGSGPQSPPPGMGGQVMGGLATGLAVGAGALAAQEIGRRMLGDQQQHGIGSVTDSRPGSDSQLARDAGLGSVGRPAAGPELPQDFGIDDTASWDDGGSPDVDGADGGGWDS